jgi:hypothetical protein
MKRTLCADKCWPCGVNFGPVAAVLLANLTVCARGNSADFGGRPALLKMHLLLGGFLAADMIALSWAGNVAGIDQPQTQSRRAAGLDPHPGAAVRGLCRAPMPVGLGSASATYGRFLYRRLCFVARAWAGWPTSILDSAHAPNCAPNSGPSSPRAWRVSLGGTRPEARPRC